MSADVLGLIACPSTVPEHDNQQRGGGKGAVHSLMVVADTNMSRRCRTAAIRCGCFACSPGGRRDEECRWHVLVELPESRGFGWR